MADTVFDTITHEQAQQLSHIRGRLQELAKTSRKFNPPLAQMIIGVLTAKLGRLGRMTFLNFAFGHNPPLQSSKDFPIHEIAALTAWADPIKQGKAWTYRRDFISDLSLLRGIFNPADAPAPEVPKDV